MGTSKALLEWHGSTLVRHTVDLVARSVDGPVVVVRSPGQELGGLPDATWVVDDTRPGAGPLAALATGLDALDGHADRVFTCGVDTPFVTPAFVAVLMEALADGVDIALPTADGRRQPLPAAVRVAVAATAHALVDDGHRALFALVERCRSRDVVEDVLRAADPSLASLRNLNDRASYEAALAEAAPRPTIEGDGHGVTRS